MFHTMKCRIKRTVCLSCPGEHGIVAELGVITFPSGSRIANNYNKNVNKLKLICLKRQDVVYLRRGYWKRPLLLITN